MKKWIVRFVVVLGSLLLAVLALEYLMGPLPGELTRIESKGKSMVGKIEDFNREHGQYPSDLEQADIHDTQTRFGKWDYQVSSNGFSLHVGNYGRYGFVLGYQTGAGWWRDT